jgi:hypothetical protein
VTKCASQCGVAAWLAHLSSFKGLLSVNEPMKHRKLFDIEKDLANVRLQMAAQELRVQFRPVSCSYPVLDQELARKRVLSLQADERRFVEELQRAQGQLDFVLKFA